MGDELPSGCRSCLASPKTRGQSFKRELKLNIEPRICEFCGKEFTPRHKVRPDAVRKPKYCSIICSLAGQKRNGHWRDKLIGRYEDLPDMRKGNP